jgi:Domain of unknown function (DUF4160)
MDSISVATYNTIMPRISEFYGIVIEMYWSDHNPPHFHAKYGEHRAEIDIRSLSVLKGHLPTKATSLVAEWAALHRDELLQRWDDARRHQPLSKIEPLE